MKRRAKRPRVSQAALPVIKDECASAIRERTIRNRGQGILAYAAILATCAAGIVHLSWWAFVAGACALALISISNHAAASRALGATTNGEVGVLLVSSVLNAAVTSAAALAIGRGIAWVWGV